MLELIRLLLSADMHVDDEVQEVQRDFRAVEAWGCVLNAHEQFIKLGSDIDSRLATTAAKAVIIALSSTLKVMSQSGSVVVVGAPITQFVSDMGSFMKDVGLPILRRKLTSKPRKPLPSRIERDVVSPRHIVPMRFLMVLTTMRPKSLRLRSRSLVRSMAPCSTVSSPS